MSYNQLGALQILIGFKQCLLIHQPGLNVMSKPLFFLQIYNLNFCYMGVFLIFFGQYPGQWILNMNFLL